LNTRWCHRLIWRCSCRCWSNGGYYRRWSGGGSVGAVGGCGSDWRVATTLTGSTGSYLASMSSAKRTSSTTSRMGPRRPGTISKGRCDPRFAPVPHRRWDRRRCRHPQPTLSSSGCWSTLATTTTTRNATAAAAAVTRCRPFFARAPFRTGSATVGVGDVVAATAWFGAKSPVGQWVVGSVGAGILPARAGTARRCTASIRPWRRTPPLPRRADRPRAAAAYSGPCEIGWTRAAPLQCHPDRHHHHHGITQSCAMPSTKSKVARAIRTNRLREVYIYIYYIALPTHKNDE
jgi:hypothetical protein